MTELFHTEAAPQMICWDKMFYTTFADQLETLKSSKTVYVGNLSFFTTELQIQETFSIVGPIKRIIMGLNRNTKTPCGFCFVEYYTREHAAACLNYVSGTVCDDRIIRCDMDGGFRPGRQYGRGRSGGQIRDERRPNYDPGRGGPCAQSQALMMNGLTASRGGERASSSSLGKRGRNSSAAKELTPSPAKEVNTVEKPSDIEDSAEQDTIDVNDEAKKSKSEAAGVVEETS